MDWITQLMIGINIGLVAYLGKNMINSVDTLREKIHGLDVQVVKLNEKLKAVELNQVVAANKTS